MKSLLCLGVVIGLCGWAPDDEFDKATAKAAGMAKYGFKLTVKSEGGGGGGGGGRGMPPADVKVDKDIAAEIKAGENTAYKKGDVLVYKEGESWKKYERQQGGGQQGQNKQQAALRALQGLKLPHEVLAEFGKKLKEVKKAEAKENDCTVFSGELTDEAAKELGALGGRGGGGGQAGGLTYAGSGKFWVNADGTIVKFEILINAKGKIRDKDVDIKSTRTYEISDVDNVKLEVPEDVTKILAP
jgi:hypothetical protein